MYIKREIWNTYFIFLAKTWNSSLRSESDAARARRRAARAERARQAEAVQGFDVFWEENWFKKTV